LDLEGILSLAASVTKYLIDYTVAKLQSSIILRQNVINTPKERWTSSQRNRANVSYELSKITSLLIHVSVIPQVWKQIDNSGIYLVSAAPVSEAYSLFPLGVGTQWKKVS